MQVNSCWDCILRKNNDCNHPSGNLLDVSLAALENRVHWGCPLLSEPLTISVSRRVMVQSFEPDKTYLKLQEATGKSI